MTRKTWRAKIKKACVDAGTYQPFFDSVIDTLSVLMETRDGAQKAYEDAGAEPIVEHTNNNGSTNTAKNPLLLIIMDCNTQALAYWRDLGLTPAGLKKLNESALKSDGKKVGLEEVLGNLGI